MGRAGSHLAPLRPGISRNRPLPRWMTSVPLVSTIIDMVLVRTFSRWIASFQLELLTNSHLTQTTPRLTIAVAAAEMDDCRSRTMAHISYF
jgi:hypothetical protein